MTRGGTCRRGEKQAGEQGRVETVASLDGAEIYRSIQEMTGRQRGPKGFEDIGGDGR